MWGRCVALVVLAALAVGCSDSGEDPSSEPAPENADADPCGPWTVESVATGLGAVENLLAEPDGGLLLSVADAGEVRRLDPADGTTTAVLDDLPSSGGLARDDEWVYVTTGLTIESAIQGAPNGTIVRFDPDPDSGTRETWASGLVAPNGLALLPDGSAVTTRTLSGAGGPSEVTRVPGDDPGRLEPLWSDLTGTNGAAVDAAGEWLYVSRVGERAEVWRLRTDDPLDRELVADLGEGLEQIPDDITVTSDDVVYAAAFAAGTVYRIDATTGASCPIATGLPQVTAVEPHPDGKALYASSMSGTLYSLTPPQP